MGEDSWKNETWNILQTVWHVKDPVVINHTVLHSSPIFAQVSILCSLLWTISLLFCVNSWLMDVYYIVKLLGPFRLVPETGAFLDARVTWLLSWLPGKRPLRPDLGAETDARGWQNGIWFLLILILKDEIRMEVRQGVACNSVYQTFQLGPIGRNILA